MIKSALFDLDGVLSDTETIYTRIWSAIGNAYPTGYDDFAQRIKGTTLPQILSTYFPDAEIQTSVKQMLDQAEDSMEYPIYDGVVDFLKDLRAAGIRTAIVTSSSRQKMERFFAANPGFDAYFDTILTDADVESSKPIRTVISAPPHGWNQNLAKALYSKTAITVFGRDRQPGHMS